MCAWNSSKLPASEKGNQYSCEGVACLCQRAFICAEREPFLRQQHVHIHACRVPLQHQLLFFVLFTPSNPPQWTREQILTKYPNLCQTQAEPLPLCQHCNAFEGLLKLLMKRCKEIILSIHPISHFCSSPKWKSTFENTYTKNNSCTPTRFPVCIFI